MSGHRDPGAELAAAYRLAAIRFMCRQHGFSIDDATSVVDTFQQEYGLGRYLVVYTRDGDLPTSGNTYLSSHKSRRAVGQSIAGLVYSGDRLASVLDLGVGYLLSVKISVSVT